MFAGIGGLDLGLERAGMRCRWQVEIDPYCCRVLEKHWPDVRRYEDVKEIRWEEVEPVDLVAGGFPCQPVSVAGKQLREDDDRWLWPEFRRCLGVVRPAYVLVENVPGLLTGGMGTVLGELAELGYDAEWETLPAAAFGAPHLRFRVFLVAQERRPPGRVPDADGSGLRLERQRRRRQRGEREQAGLRDDGAPRALADSDGQRLEERRRAEPVREELGSAERSGQGPGSVPDAAGLGRGEGESAAVASMWPTPTAGDAKASGSRNLEGSSAHAGVSLTDAVRYGNSSTPRWATPKSSPSGPDYARAGREESGGDDLATQVARGTPGQLNPTWVEWLMGFPLGWTDLEPSETP
jgi:DNA (cytosine-5)-methyltransferase 1